MPKKCKYCGTKLELKPKGQKKIFCSNACSHNYNYHNNPKKKVYMKKFYATPKQKAIRDKYENGYRNSPRGKFVSQLRFMLAWRTNKNDIKGQHKTANLLYYWRHHKQELARHIKAYWKDPEKFRAYCLAWYRKHKDDAEFKAHRNLNTFIHTYSNPKYINSLKQSRKAR